MLTVVLLAFGVQAADYTTLSLTWSRTGSTADDVEVYVADEYGVVIDGAEVVFTSTHEFKETTNAVTESILCPDVNATTYPEIELTFSITGLPESMDYNVASLDIHALNSSGSYQSNSDAKVRQWNVDIQIGESEDELSSFGSFTDIDIADGVGSSGNVHQYWYVTSTDMQQTGTELVIRIAISSGTTNVGCFFGLSEIQLYASTGLKSLEMLVDSVSNLGLNYVAGEDPGYYETEIVEAYETALAAAEEAIAEGVASDTECDELAAALREALAALQAAEVIPLPTGYYYIVNASSFTETSTDDDTYGDVIDVEKAMYDDAEGYALWATLDTLDLEFMWLVTELDEGGYSIQNLYSGDYIYGAASQSASVPMVAEQEIVQHFAGVGDGTWGIYSDLSAYSYHPNNHEGGTGVSGDIVTWQTNYTTTYRNTWYTREITDTELIDSLLAVRAVELLNETLQELIDSAEVAVELAKTYPSEDNPQYSYIDGLAEIVDELESKAEEYTAVVEALEATQEQIDEMRELLAQFYALAAETTEYEELLAEAEALVEGALVGEDPGYFPEEAITALEEAIAAAEEAFTESPTAETLAAAVAILEAAIEEFEASMNQIETGKWYYVISAASAAYYCDNDLMGKYLHALYGVVDATLYNGYAVLRDCENELDAHYMWKVEDAGDGTYYLINRAMGVGLRPGDGLYYQYLMSATYGAWSIEYATEGTYYIYYPGTSDDYYLCGWSDIDDNITDLAILYSSWMGSYWDEPYWQFVAVDLGEDEDEGAAFTIPFLNNNIKIETLPFSVGYWGDESDPVSVGEMNGEDVWATYAVQSITYDETDDITTVNLTRADYFDAGEPFVLVTGDPDMYEGYLTYGDTIDIMFPVTDEFVIEGGKANGLAGNLVYGYCYIDSAGYIDHDDDYITYAFTSSDGTSIAYNSGYFLMNAEETEDEVDYQIFFEGGKITGVKSATQIAEEKAAVATGNVYDLQGRQVSEPGKGIYIVGGKKVIYK